jgi:hypothetical protein
MGRHRSSKKAPPYWEIFIFVSLIAMVMAAIVAVGFRPGR